MKKGIVYVRVSSADQTQGTSLDNQERACLEYAQKNGIEVIQTFIEKGESATAADRTEFLKALDFCRRHAGEVSAFIVWKIDRFARNTTDHFAVRAKLTKYGVALQSVTEPITQDHIGKLMETFLAGYAEFENEVRKQRCTGGMQGRLREGIWCWSPPLGYVNSKRIKDRRKTLPDVPDEERFALIQKGLRLYMAGNHTISALAKESEGWGLTTRTGKPVRKQLWEVILADKFYTGILVDPWTGEEHKGLHQPMITRAEYEQIQTIKRRMSNNAKAPRLSAHPDFALRRFVLCECGRFYTASWSKGRNKRYAFYHCVNRRCAHFGRSVAREEMEAKFQQLLRNISPVPKVLDFFQSTVIERYQKQHVSTEKEKTRLRRQLAKLETRRRTLMEMRVGQEISKEEYQEMKDAVDSQIAALNKSVYAPEDGYDMATATARAVAVIGNVAGEWQAMNLPCKQRLQKLVLPQGIVYQKTTGTFGTAIVAPIFRLNETFLNSLSDFVAEVRRNWNQILQDIKAIYEIAVESDGQHERPVTP